MYFARGAHGELTLETFQLGQRSMTIGAWRKDGTWLKVHDKLYQWVRVAAGREPSPKEAAVNSQERGNSNNDFQRGRL